MRAAFSVLPLPVAMIEPSFGTLLMPAIGAAPLAPAGLIAAGAAAIALSAITVRAEEEQGAAFLAETNPQPQNHFSLSPHAPSQAGLDRQALFVAR